MAELTAGDMLPASLDVDNPTGELAPSPLCFPTEFPFEFDSSTLSSAFTSPGDSTETEDESSDDEEDFLAGLTRRLALSTQRLPPPSFANEKTEEKRQIVSTSPQSTLSGLGSWSASGSGSPNGLSSQVTSPPTTPFRKDDAWDVISAAAGQVAMLKMGCGGEPLLRLPYSNPNPLFQSRASSPGPIPSLPVRQQSRPSCLDLGFQPFNNHSSLSSQCLHNECEAKQQLYADWLWHSKASCYQTQMKFKQHELQASRRVKAASWLRSEPSQQQACSDVQSVFPLGSAVKRPCSGTGVFLPRRYSNPSDSRKNSGGSSAVFPSKVVHPQNLNFGEFNGMSQPHLRPFLSRHNNFNCDTLRTRSGLLVRQGGFRPVPGSFQNQERHLPQEWMY